MKTTVSGQSVIASPFASCHCEPVRQTGVAIPQENQKSKVKNQNDRAKVKKDPSLPLRVTKKGVIASAAKQSHH